MQNLGRSVRRRFRDFRAFYEDLLEAHPTCIIPPLPGKHRIVYLSGDRFSPEFVEKRIQALQRFLTRIMKHAELSKSKYLYEFVSSPEYVSD